MNDKKIFGESTIKSYITKNSRRFKVTLEQLEAMKLSPSMEKLMFGRTSKEWREALEKK